MYKNVMIVYDVNYLLPPVTYWYNVGSLLSASKMISTSTLKWRALVTLRHRAYLRHLFPDFKYVCTNILHIKYTVKVYKILKMKNFVIKAGFFHYAAQMYYWRVNGKPNNAIYILFNMYQYLNNIINVKSCLLWTCV